MSIIQNVEHYIDDVLKPDLPASTHPFQWFVTFPFRLSDRRYKYWIVDGASEEEAREKTVQRWGNSWAFMYPISELNAQIVAYNLSELLP